MRFEEWVRFCAYGDDNLGQVHPEIAGWYNMLVLKEKFRDWFGMNYTTPGKDDVTSPFLAKDQISFLARKFRPIVHEGAIVAVAAPLDMDSIYGMLAWIRQPPEGAKDSYGNPLTVDTQLQANIRTAIAEMSNYPKRQYNQFRFKLLGWCKKAGIQCPVVMDYEIECERNIDQYHYVSTDLVNDVPVFLGH
jgi:hypothetical protein